MSWDIVALNVLTKTETASDIPNDFKPPPLGPRSEIIAKILEVAPDADFTDPSWGFIRQDDRSININLGKETICESCGFHVRGGDGAAGMVAAILDHLKLRAVDCQSGEFFTAGPESLESFRSWREYRDRVVGD